MPNPVFKENNEWFFWDESWSNRIGPFKSKGKAEEELKKYVKYLDSEAVL